MADAHGPSGKGERPIRRAGVCAAALRTGELPNEGLRGPVTSQVGGAPRYEPVSYRSAPCNTSISVLLRRVVQTAPA